MESTNSEFGKQENVNFNGFLWLTIFENLKKPNIPNIPNMKKTSEIRANINQCWLIRDICKESTLHL